MDYIWPSITVRPWARRRLARNVNRHGAAYSSSGKKTLRHAVNEVKSLDLGGICRSGNLAGLFFMRR